MCRSLEWVRVFRCFGPWPPSRHPSGGWAIPRAPWWCPQFVMQVVVLTSLDHCSRSLCVSTRLLQSFAISYAVLASGWSKHIPGAAGRGPNYCSVISAPDLPPVEAKRLAPNPKKKKLQEGAKCGQVGTSLNWPNFLSCPQLQITQLKPTINALWRVTPSFLRPAEVVTHASSCSCLFWSSSREAFCNALLSAWANEPVRGLQMFPAVAAEICPPHSLPILIFSPELRRSQGQTRRDV